MDYPFSYFETLLPPPGGNPGGLALSSLIGASDAFLAMSAALRSDSAPVFAIAPGIPHADRLVDDLTILSAKTPVRILEFPPKLGDDRSALGQRLKTIAALRAWQLNPYPLIVVAPFPALATPLPSDSLRPLQISPRGISFSDLGARLAAAGYERVPQVEKEGDYSIRGGIVDAWSPGDEFPIRAEFFGDDLESLRSFNAATQTSIGRLESATLLPVREAEAERNSDDIRGQASPRPLRDRGQTLFDLLPEGSTVLALEHNDYPLSSVLESRSPILNFIFTGDPPPPGVPTGTAPLSALPGFSELGAGEAHHPEIFEAARKRLDQHLAAAERRGAEILKIDTLSGGFEFSPTESGSPLIVVTKADRVFTRHRSVMHRASGIPTGARVNDFDDLEPGEYVVHVDYGVGRYIGSSFLNLDGEQSEVYTIEYADGAKLHVPAAHAHLLSRYIGVRGESVRLHRLDGKRWEKDKKDAQKAVSDLAAALLETQAKRETVPGYAYDTACDGREAFDAAFPYEETADQLAAISAVEKDLASTKPMDRLLCGDAGYGKTEVAMRAAFIAAMNGRQVAVLAPTTVLAEQHFETFTSRFDGTPVRIESVSRFQSAKVHSGTFDRLANGVCDIVIGTHAILSNRIRFRDLGLIIIDEEQRFGVRHKEFLKALRATADVLTLSATPIPRTLYLSMTGARDLSLLRSPPSDRTAVETRIVRDSDELIRTAIESEILRGGQVYFLHNRVTTMSRVEKRLRALCPKARIITAHGQMDTHQLALRMRDFERGDYDVLLSTTIVESGIDIPRANTILVDRADTFGLSELYQLRGRVGRSSKQGYAYFLLPPSGDIDSDARERLAALKRHGGLGAGFNLAVRDLELRGAGNLLGSQQSGHIAAVGFNLYCQLLKRTIALMKGEKVKDVIDVRLNLDFAMPRLPCDYVEEDVMRLSLMKRFAQAQDLSAVNALAAELKDRFGPLPPAAKEFVKYCELRVRCAREGISRVDVKAGRAIFYRGSTTEIAFVEMLRGKSPAERLGELLRLSRNRTAER